MGGAEPQVMLLSDKLQPSVVVCEVRRKMGWQREATQSKPPLLPKMRLMEICVCLDGVAQAPRQLLSMFAGSPPLQGRVSRGNPARENLWAKHLVGLIARFPCAGSSAACSEAVHARSVRTELLLNQSL